MSTAADLSSVVTTVKAAAGNAVAQKNKALELLQAENATLNAQVADLTAQLAASQSALDAAVADLQAVTQELNEAFTFT